ncbi:MAG: DUF799 family lipoprotein [Deltaproteobacteria bacterium]
MSKRLRHCTGTAKGDPNIPIIRLAVLPFRNDTTDVDAPNFVRERLIPALERRLYHVIPVEETDRILRDQLGITLGGQLEMASVAKLKEALQADGLLYGTIMDFGEVTTGLVNERKVRGKFKIIDTATETVFWENGLGVKSQDTSGGLAGCLTGTAADIGGKDEEVPWVVIERESSNKSVLEGFAAGLTEKLVTKAMGVHLQHETDEMIWRLVQNLPWGPGGSVAAEAVAAAPAVMPPMRMPPPPSIGYMDYGDRDFSAVMVSTTLNKEEQQSMTFEMPIAKAGEKFRMEMDYAKMTGAENMPAGIRLMIMIHRGDQKKTYSIYPARKKYIISEETDDGYYQGTDEKPDIQKTFVGNEVVDGHPTQKYKVSISYRNEGVQEGFIWNATDLDDMTIQTVIETPQAKVTTLLKNVVLATPAADLFEIPADYSETNNYMELIMQSE